MDAARACQQAIEGSRLYGERLQCEVIEPANDLFERVRGAWGRYWVAGEQEAIVGPVLMKVKMAAPIEWPRSKKMLVAVRTINSASGHSDEGWLSIRAPNARSASTPFPLGCQRPRQV